MKFIRIAQILPTHHILVPLALVHASNTLFTEVNLWSSDRHGKVVRHKGTGSIRALGRPRKTPTRSRHWSRLARLAHRAKMSDTRFPQRSVPPTLEQSDSND